MTENQNKSINIFIVFLGVTAIVFVFNHLIYVLFFGGSFFPSINPINLIANSNLLAVPLALMHRFQGVDVGFGILYWLQIMNWDFLRLWYIGGYFSFFSIIAAFILWIIGPVLNFIIAFIIKKVIWK